MNRVLEVGNKNVFLFSTVHSDLLVRRIAFRKPTVRISLNVIQVGSIRIQISNLVAVAWKKSYSDIEEIILKIKVILDTTRMFNIIGITRGYKYYGF